MNRIRTQEKTQMDSELFYRIALQHIEGYGQATLKKMLRYSGSAKGFFTQPELWRAHLQKRSKPIPNPTLGNSLVRQVEQEMRMMERHDIRLSFFLDADYPYRLKGCSDAPISFYYLGKPIFNNIHTLAVVGTRDASEYGRESTRKLLSDLRDSDITTVSGLAYGIDSEAHLRSIEYGIPTIAVLGNGLGNIYPKSNEPLAQQIVEQGGALISEYGFRTLPDRQNFPRRNRIIAGLADAVLVAETAEKGGSIITAYIAHSYNRDIFAIPGSIFDQHYNGCHELIRKNMAAIVTNGQQLKEMMNWDTYSTQNVQTSMFLELDEQENSVVELLRSGAVPLDSLSESLSELSPSKLAGILLGLELKGVITCKPGKVYCLNA